MAAEGNEKELSRYRGLDVKPGPWGVVIITRITAAVAVGGAEPAGNVGAMVTT